MPAFELVLDQVQPFDDVDLHTDVRVSGTYVDLENYMIDLLEVPAPGGRWRTINRLHPLWRGSTLTDGLGRAVDRPAAVERIEAVIQEAMSDEAAEHARRVSLGTCIDPVDLRDRLGLEVSYA